MPLLSFLLYVFVTSFTPGPNNIMAMLFANKYGFKKTLRFCLGVGAGFFVIMILVSYFNLLLKNFIPKIEFADDDSRRRLYGVSGYKNNNE